MEDWLRKAIEDGLAADAREREEEAARYADWRKTNLIDRAKQRFLNFGTGTCKYQYLWPERVQNDRLPLSDAFWRRKARKLVILAGRMQRHPAHAEAMARLQADGNPDRAAAINLLRLASTCDVDGTESTMRQLLTRPDGSWLAEKGKIRFGLIHSLPSEIMRAVTEAAAAVGREDAAQSLPPAFLGLEVNRDARTVSRPVERYSLLPEPIRLSPQRWHLFIRLFDAGESGATDAELRNNYPGENDSGSTWRKAFSDLRDALKNIDIGVSKPDGERKRRLEDKAPPGV